ncbi:MAG: UDP-N-acetylmuramate dehydrogenase [Ruminococcaceae bacterium]|nr:UDP-N-acetylmuramate dehydrogenase [Oscillospiraceae bacterium]
MNIVYNELMKNHTSFKIGGPCDEFAQVTSEEEVAELIEYAKSKGIPYTVMGNGSNLLVSDKGIRGLVIKLAKGFEKAEVSGNSIICQSGILLSKLSNFALKNNLSGLEFASGIPGTLGGAIYMNAGAYGGEMKDVVREVTYLENGEIKTSSQCDFGYRHSIFTDSDAIILSARLELCKGEYDVIKARMEELSAKRNEKQPLSMPSAGSTFKRPEGYFAGKLIEDAGLRGFSIGGAMVSEKHCGFVVNCGNATCSDVVELIHHVQKVVYDKFGVKLEPEVKILGEV